MNKLLAIDGMSILNRGFYGLPDLSNSKGQHTGAILGFLNIVLKIIDEEKPTHLAVAFDVKSPTFRHEMFKEYKGTRNKMPEELLSQVPVMKELLRAMGVLVIEKPGFEADDILGTLSVMGEKEGYEVTILSGDRDLLQLATEKVMIKIPKTSKGKTTIYNYHASDVFDEYGVTPHEFIDMKGLMGDSSDNIPGVPGIGPKTAGNIIKEYHSIENAYADIDNIKPKKAMENFKEFYDVALMSKELATIICDVSLDESLSNAVKGELFTSEAYKLVKELELKSILKYFSVEEKTNDAPEMNNVFIEDITKADAFFEEAKNHNLIGVADLSSSDQTEALSFTYDGKCAYILPMGLFFNTIYIKEKLSELLKLNPDMRIVCIDIKHLLHVLDAFDDEVLMDESKAEDVSLAAYLLNPNKDSYLYDDIARDYMNAMVQSEKELVGKTEINAFILQDESISKALMYKTLIPFIAWNNIKSKLEETEMMSLYRDIELPTAYVLYTMEREGIKVDSDALKEYGQMLKEKIDGLEKAIYEEAGFEFNINSPKQLGEVLFEKMNLPGAKKTKTGYSTNADVLNKLKGDYPFVANILDYRQFAKLKSTYADGLSEYISQDHRIHGTFNQTIAATGRLSSTEPNLQNIPMRTELGRSIRKVFVPKEDYIFVDADYSQIELRILSHLSNDEKLIAAYNDGEDIHAITASKVFGVPIDEVDDLQRRRAKAVNFGIVYGISAFGLSEDLEISRKEASQYITQYFETFPGVKEFLDKTVENAKKTGYTKTLYNRIRQIPELSSSNFMQRSFGERAAMNSPIQGTAADIMKIAMIKVYKRLKSENLKSKLILQIHDELLIETYKDEKDKVIDILKEEMMSAADLKVPLNISVSSGQTWYEAK